MDFEHAEKKFKQLKAQFKTGELTETEFKSELEELMFQDEGDNWWMIGYETELWYRYDGSKWVQSNPPSALSQPSKPIVPTKPEVTKRESSEKAAREKTSLEKFDFEAAWEKAERRVAEKTAREKAVKTKVEEKQITKVKAGTEPVVKTARDKSEGEVADKDARERVDLNNEKRKLFMQTLSARGRRFLLSAIIVILILVFGIFIIEGELPFFFSPTTSTMVSPKDGMTMIHIPAGKFMMGNNSGESDESPVHEVNLDSFWIDRTEVTNAMYELCVQAKECNQPSDTTYFGHSTYANYPVTFVSWTDAKQYCGWVGRRLPTEAEWEKAARGDDRRLFPWGNVFDCKKGNFDDETQFDAYTVPGGANCDGNKYVSPVGNFSSGASPFGVLDMAGNVWEWVADWYKDSYYSNSTSMNPLGPNTGDFKVLRGGSWSVSLNVIRSTNRFKTDPVTTSSDIGFRCTRSP